MVEGLSLSEVLRSSDGGSPVIASPRSFSPYIRVACLLLAACLLYALCGPYSCRGVGVSDKVLMETRAKDVGSEYSCHLFP